MNTRYLERAGADHHFGRSERVRDVLAYLPYSDAKEAYPLDNFAEASAPYLAFQQELKEYSLFRKNQADTGVPCDQAYGIRLWRQFGRGKPSRVQLLEWTGSDTLMMQLPSGIYTTNTESNFQQLKKTEFSFTEEKVLGKIPEVLKHAKPSARQGRGFKAAISAWSRWGKHSWIIGTEDGCVALFNEKTKLTYALGAIGVHGPVHQLVVAKGLAYGVSGDPQDLGNLFHYSDQTGLRELGRLIIVPDDQPVFSNSQPIRVAIAPDGAKVAVSVADELGCVYIFKSVSFP